MPHGTNIWGTSSILQVRVQAELVGSDEFMLTLMSPVTFRELQSHPEAPLHMNCTEHLHSFQGSYTIMKSLSLFYPSQISLSLYFPAIILFPQLNNTVASRLWCDSYGL